MNERVMVMHIENFTKPLFQVVLLDFLIYINWGNIFTVLLFLILRL